MQKQYVFTEEEINKIRLYLKVSSRHLHDLSAKMKSEEIVETLSSTSIIDFAVKDIKEIIGMIQE